MGRRAALLGRKGGEGQGGRWVGGAAAANLLVQLAVWAAQVEAQRFRQDPAANAQRVADFGVILGDASAAGHLDHAAATRALFHGPRILVSAFAPLRVMSPPLARSDKLYFAPAHG